MNTYKLLDPFANKMEDLTGWFITFHARPIYARDIHIQPDETTVQPKIAILLQGNFVSQHNFTAETIKIYRKYFPQALIIVSAWEDDLSGPRTPFSDKYIRLIVNQKPADPGFKNVNLQLASSLAGINEAKRLGAKYVLKTRTDQRIYHPYVLNFFLALLEQFPVSPGFQQKERLIGICLGPNREKLYQFSDMLLFGRIDDMERYWSADPVMQKADIKPVHTPESYLFTRFLYSIGRDVAWTLEDSLKAYASHCIAVDPPAIDWYWHKYERHREYRALKRGHYRDPIVNTLSFLEWLRLYHKFS